MLVPKWSHRKVLRPRRAIGRPLVWAVDLQQVVVHEVWAESTQRQRYEAKLCLRPSVKVSEQSTE